MRRVFIPVAEAKCGDDLSKAMVLADDSIKTVIATPLLDELPQKKQKKGNKGVTTAGAVRGSKAMHAATTDSMEKLSNKEGMTGTSGEPDEDSVTDSDMDEVIKVTTLDRKARNVMHRVNKNWGNKITAAITKEIEVDNNPKSAAGRKR